MILIDALFIANEGGGPNLLRYLLDKIKSLSKEKEFFLLLDTRFQHNVTGFEHVYVPRGLKNRYRFYKQNKNKFTSVFCFANTPPPVKLKVPVATYFHNQMLLESTRHRFDQKYFRYYLRYFFVKLFNRNTDLYIVQTDHMVNEIVATGLKKREQCKTFPFYQLPANSDVNNSRVDDFVYISAASPYKNHIRLLQAWERLNEQGLKPVLHLTVDPSATEVYTLIKNMQQKGFNILNHGYTDPAPLYNNCRYMIYPSLNESFGLSLIEGAHAGMKILAADLPYVKAVIDPSAVFDPYDVESISAAVSNALKNALPFPQIHVRDEAEGLIEFLLNN